MSQELKKEKDSEIDLLHLAKVLWTNRKKAIYAASIIVALGLFVAIVSPKEWTASSAFIPQATQPTKVGGLSGLASLAGFNIGDAGNGSELPPTLYAKLASTVDFKLALLDAKIQIEGSEQEVTYRTYFEEIWKPDALSIISQYTIQLPRTILNAIRGSNPSSEYDQGELIRLTKREVELFKRLDAQLSISFDAKEGLVGLRFKMPEALMSAQMAKFAQNLLQERVIDFRIHNAREQLQFVQKRFDAKKKEFEDIQMRLATYKDQNQNITSSTAQIGLQILQSEYDFASSVYIELGKQLEQAKIQVSKDTPVFSEIHTLTIPAERSAPRRSLILAIFVILGIVFGTGYVLAVELLRNLKLRWNKID